eukprot:CAMPEP_0175045476 /NCGR_PEP_ID=MMETSP0052_2-20121109/4447_1 /TAXON_ID=51329 ORGANISM="Polytomella parva, Strain SAG 63-3" /NCGR_SAMPLE_ID=MMETSP0052_2 /ASSEMBLY_ACC=CAM_ASM_000194 /LENGTH=317 /DNA_ID=CAMNT_0016309017 /DNA_START=514 /DNA_END=1467 /DNA_ORIENTATION=+
MAFIFFIGVFFSSWWGTTLLGLSEWLIRGLPFIKHIYSASKQVSAALNPENEAAKAFQECVLIRHPRLGELALAFITGRTELHIDDDSTTICGEINNGSTGGGSKGSGIMGSDGIGMGSNINSLGNNNMGGESLSNSNHLLSQGDKIGGRGGRLIFSGYNPGVDGAGSEQGVGMGNGGALSIEEGGGGFNSSNMTDSKFLTSGNNNISSNNNNNNGMLMNSMISNSNISSSSSCGSNAKCGSSGGNINIHNKGGVMRRQKSLSLVIVYVPTNHVYVGDVFFLEEKDIIHTNLTVREGLEVVISCGMAVPSSLQHRLV